jgi:hypothetical protein
MQIKTPVQFQTFNDGICRICRLENTAEPGLKPVKELVTKHDRVPYEKRKVGVTRFYTAMQENVEIEALLRVPGQFAISTQDYCIIDGRQYGIHQVQEVPDTMPPSCDLSLKKTEAEYDIAGI